MHNPWDPEDTTVPDDGGVTQSGRRLTLLGVALWLVVIAMAGSVLFVADVSQNEATALLMKIGRVTAVTLGLAMGGWLTYQLLTRLNLFGGLLPSLFRLGFVLGIFPIGVWLAIQQFDLLAGPVVSDIIQSLPIDTSMLDTVGKQIPEIAI